MPIFDQGYQHWSGKLSGHTWRWLAITRHGIRASRKSRVLRILLLAAWVPALTLALLLCLWGMAEQKSSMVGSFVQLFSSLMPGIAKDPRSYRVDVWRLCYTYFLMTELYISMILILLVGPTLISQDLRFNALPLYFSRPLRRIDYFVGKLGVIVAFLGMVMIVPAIVAYILGLAFSLDISILRDTFGILLSSIAFGMIISVSAGLLVLAMSALSRNSRYIALAWIGLWFVGVTVSWVLQTADSEQRRYAYYHEMSIPPPTVSGRRSSRDRQEMDQWMQAQEQARTSFRAQQLEYSKKDWRPLISYTANLSRLGEELLGTHAVWEDLGKLQPDPYARERLLQTFMGPQYPWYWSALVLAGLFGLSACILKLSVKSVDRLK